MIWRFETISKTGKVSQGSLTGSRADIKRILHEQGQEIIDISPDIKQWLLMLTFNKQVNFKVLAQSFEDLNHMLTSGMNLPEAIDLVKQNIKDPVMQGSLIVIKERLLCGDSFSESLRYSRCFPSLVVSCIKCGEQTGRLSETIALLGQFFKYRNQLAGDLFNAFFYPIIVGVVLMAVMVFVSLKVIPQLKPLLPVGALDHPATALILSLTTTIQQYGVLMAMLIVVLIVFIGYLVKEHSIKAENLLYQIPHLGLMFKEINLSICLTHLTVLVKSGVSIIQAINDLHLAMPNAITGRLMVCRSYMVGGSSFSHGLQEDVFFPPALVFAIKKAEQTVQWDVYLNHSAQYFDKRSKSKIHMMTQMIQPLMLGLSGLFLVTIGMAFLVPVYGSLTKIAGGN